MANTLIENTKYNNLQERISALLGNSTTTTPQTGYGQSVISDKHYPVTSPESTIITAEQYEDIYLDIVRARIHQVGVNNFTIADYVKGSREFGTNADKIALTYINGLESLMTDIETDKFSAHPTQLNIVDYEPIGNGYTDRRVTSWNTKLEHIFRITFASTAARRHFFNAGGEIRIQARLTNAGNGKAQDWAGLLETAGIIRMAALETRQTKDYSTTTFPTVTNPDIFAVGNYNLSNGYQTLFRKSSNALNNSGVYSSNLMQVDAKNINNSTIEFKIILHDSAGDGNIDNIIIGEVETLIQAATPNGTVSVDGSDYTTVVVDSPIYSLITSLSEPTALVQSVYPPPQPNVCENPPDVFNVRGIYSPDNRIIWSNGRDSGYIDMLVRPFDSVGTQIERLYIDELGRQPDWDGFNYWYDEWITLGEAATRTAFLNSAGFEKTLGGATVYTYCEYQELIS